MAELYGVVAQYGSPDAVKAAAQTMRDHGYLQIEAYTPYPIEGLDDDLGQTQTRLGWVVLGHGHGGFYCGFWHAVVG
ncbi:MAG: quinol:electron acceptor oxidoreductase subunit ActD [Deinococcales bacterium]